MEEILIFQYQCLGEAVFSGDSEISVRLRTGRPGVLQSMGSQRVGQDWTELKETEALEVLWHEDLRDLLTISSEFQKTSGGILGVGKWWQVEEEICRTIWYKIWRGHFEFLVKSDTDRGAGYEISKMGRASWCLARSMQTLELPRGSSRGGWTWDRLTSCLWAPWWFLKTEAGMLNVFTVSSSSSA